LIVRILRIFHTLSGSLALLAGFLATTLLTGLLTRGLILLARLVLIAHLVSFHGNAGPIASAPGRSQQDKTQFAFAPRGDCLPNTLRGTGLFPNPAIVANSQAVEHYEMSRYGTLIAWAEELGHDDVVRLLTTNLNEEKAANTKLNTVATRKGVNKKASAA
jgi:hypothetical protein